MSKHAKNLRTLDLYLRLSEGKRINKAEEANRFEVDERSIQRDLDDLRSFLLERASEHTMDTREIIYDRMEKAYRMIGNESAIMSNSEILAVSKVLLESRAFTKTEINGILNKLIAGCVPQKNMKLVTDLIANEKYHYVELRHKSQVQDRLWELGNDIKQCNILEITYKKQNEKEEAIKRLVEPVGLLFSEYYFYLNAYIVEQDSNGKYVQKYDYPAIFRVDRILDYNQTGEHFKVAYANRFEDGEFRKRVQFMYAGKLQKLKFRYTGKNVTAILDRLPTAQIIKEEEDGYILKAEAYGKGILMWLLSQGSMVEVLEPQSLREEMKQMLLEMLEKY